MKLTLRNEFHGTEVTIQPDAANTISRATYLRARRVLCGIEGCTCFQSPASGRSLLPLLGAQEINGLQAQRLGAEAGRMLLDLEAGQ